ncbi:thiamin biosynthesis protein sulfur carrier ThiS [Pantoea sp. BL1]|uniref:sulfur carrier protein ThiS n=1 Tax=Erwiniaceae TaxID=1903409 RepID=UPI0005F83B8C|nr:MULTISPECIES: sulfur carrier protein ThiS [Erwiniaceae]KJV28141.1 thiamin biosynthesis protein sulfur carrier ThiS [Pantoea sp. SM3]KJV47703.1 thiamin biosynthesis protein sulfur carrier ThiS [Pantoea sp. BL1]MBK0090202.1 sulfur carrier protein ThiS [Erwinia sp. S59]MBK0125769.1 sulfur carrier protein ThiS [Pantoea sp. S61]
MNIQLNGRTIRTEASTLSELLIEQQIDASCVASAFNGNFVPKSQYSSQQLEEGCQLEVLSPMQGG